MNSPDECVYRDTDSLFNSCNEAAAKSLLWVESRDLDTFFPAAQKSTLHHEEEAGPTGGKNKQTNSLSGGNAIIHEE